MTFYQGEKVHYQPEHYGDRYENGIIKTIHPEGDKAWVVYNCNGEWHRINNYTAALTDYRDLKEGWRDE